MNRLYGQKNKLITKLSSLVLLFAFSTLGYADGTLTYKANNGVVELQIKNRQIYIKNTNDTNDLLFDQNKNHIIVIQHAKKNFFILDEAELKNINQQISGFKSALTANLSAEQQSQLNNFLGGALGAPKTDNVTNYSLKNSGSSRIGNFNCQQFQILKNNQGIGHVCTASAQQLQLNQTDFETLKSFQSFALKAGEILHDSLSSFTKGDIPTFKESNFSKLVVFSKIQNQADSHFYIQKSSSAAVTNTFSVPRNYQLQKLVSASNLLR